MNREVNMTKKKELVPRVQVCEHLQSSCFVDLVASHARLDTEVLHLSYSLAWPDSFRGESGYAFLVETKIHIACTEFKVHIMLSKIESILSRHEI